MTVYVQDSDFTLYHGDVLEVLPRLPERSVHCCVTSPPYWGLRDYGADGQVGLEQTPSEYVEKMVAIFREVRRVLRDDATLWLNIGDSYAAGGMGGHKSSDSFHGHSGDRELAGAKKPPPGLKHKDLVGIPWSVAKALQEPYYAGDIARERDRVWLAATIDAEGSICGFLHERKDDGRVRTGVHVTITNTSRAMLDEAQRIWPTSREGHNAHGAGHYGSLPIWRWIAHGAERKAALMREMYPYLIVKRRQALLAYNLLRFQMDGKRLGRSAQGDEVRAKRALLTRLLSDANGQREVDIPSWCVEPPSLYEPGWYLRSDVIWSKSNPMPESVTDRPTKAHEYVFLLTKSARYFFDQEAVREPSTYPGPRWSSTYALKEDRGDGKGVTGLSPQRGIHKSITGDGRNVRSVWEIATQPYADAHFATFPQELPRRCIAAGTPEGGTVLDPFMGSGTTAYVARNLGRKSIGVELNGDYCALAARRMQQLSLIGDAA